MVKIHGLVFTLLLLIGCNNPEVIHYVQDETCRQVLELPGKDSLFINPVYFCSGSDGNYFYYSRLKTTVCNDTLCQLIHLKLFWDLAGNYSRFDTLAGTPLTKNDHHPFTTHDYEKLHTTLRHKNSILGDKTEDELLDDKQTRYSEKIDGVTGATVREIQSAVVDGALYSTYTLWHLANGDINQQIREFTLAHYDSVIELQLLQSGHPETIIMGLKNLDERDYFDRFDQILDIMKSGNPLVNFYIAKNLPADIFTIKENKKSIEEILNLMDHNTRSVLPKYLNP